MSRISLAERVLSKLFLDELDRILVRHNSKVHSSTKEIPRDSSRKTRHERRNNIRLIFAELHLLGYRLKDPTALRTKHLHVLGANWIKRGLAPKTIHGLFSNLREFCRWIGKSGMVQDISFYCDGREHMVRHTATTEDLSWGAKGIDLDEILVQAERLDPRLAVILRLQSHFGLRVKESIEFRPWRGTAYGDSHLYITDGTKGGKHRMIPIRSEIQRETLAGAKKMVGTRLNAQLRWPDLSWKQAQSRFYYLMRKLKITHEQSGVSPHGLRHGFLQDEYEHYAGVPSPVKNSGTPTLSRLEHKRALLAVSLEAGHFREAATGMYCGSLGHQLRSVLTPVSADTSTPDSSTENAQP